MTNSNAIKSTIDRATFTIAFERSLDVLPEDVFAAWTVPDQVSQWWDPTGAPLSECTIDLRPGGKFRFANRPGKMPAQPFEGTYTIIERPTRLVFNAMGAVGTVLFAKSGAGTRLTVNIRCASAQHLEQFVQHGVDKGTSQTLDNLVAFLLNAPK